MKRMFFALAMMALFVFGGLVVESASAQNSNSSTTMMKPGMSSMSHKHRRRWRRRHMRRGRRHGRRHGNSNM